MGLGLKNIPITKRLLGNAAFAAVLLGALAAAAYSRMGQTMDAVLEVERAARLLLTANQAEDGMGQSALPVRDMQLATAAEAASAAGAEAGAKALAVQTAMEEMARLRVEMLDTRNRELFGPAPKIAERLRVVSTHSVAEGGSTELSIQAAKVTELYNDIRGAALRFRREAMRRLADESEGSIRGIVETVASAATEMQGASEAMSSTATQASRQAAAVSAASGQTSANVQTVASATEELSASVPEIGRQVAASAGTSRLNGPSAPAGRHGRARSA